MYGERSRALRVPVGMRRIFHSDRLPAFGRRSAAVEALAVARVIGDFPAGAGESVAQVAGRIEVGVSPPPDCPYHRGTNAHEEDGAAQFEGAPGFEDFRFCDRGGNRSDFQRTGLRASPARFFFYIVECDSR